ncbi:MAG TPA: hypothetical protein VNE83_07760 [Terriglobales bacterium]|nr:hypothetical protein [Terriglobales bacterium]
MTPTRLFVITLGAGLGLAAAQGPALPPGAAQHQVAFTCTGCHTLDRICAAQKSPTEWKATVDQMLRNGAVLTPAQEAQVVRYLAAHFGHKKPLSPARRGQPRPPQPVAQR